VRHVLVQYKWTRCGNTDGHAGYTGRPSRVHTRYNPVIEHFSSTAEKGKLFARTGRKAMASNLEGIRRIEVAGCRPPQSRRQFEMKERFNERSLSHVGGFSQLPLRQWHPEEDSILSGRQHPMIGQTTSAQRGRPLLGAFVLLTLIVLMAIAASAQSWPRCITGCTANDVEFVEVTARRPWLMYSGRICRNGALGFPLFQPQHNLLCAIRRRRLH